MRSEAMWNLDLASHRTVLEPLEARNARCATTSPHKSDGPRAPATLLFLHNSRNPPKVISSNHLATMKAKLSLLLLACLLCAARAQAYSRK